jgi:S-adenosylmethionine synthetase
MKRELKLDNVKFKEVTTYGHFGREDLDVPWEDVDHKIEELLELYEEA